MDFINVIDDCELKLFNENALYIKAKSACEDNGISYSIKHQQDIEEIDNYKDRPEVINLLLASGSIYEEVDYIYIDGVGEWVYCIKFIDTNTMVLISKDTFTFKYKDALKRSSYE